MTIADERRAHRQATRDEALISFFRCTPYLVNLIVFFSSIIFGLSIAQSHQLNSEAISPDIGARKFSLTQILLYTSLVPLLSLLYAPIDLALYFLSRHSSIYALFSSPVFLAAWLTTASFWARCEVVTQPALPAYTRRSDAPSNPNMQLPSYCPQRGMATPQVYLQSPVQMAKFALSWLAVLAYLVYVLIALLAVVRGRREKTWFFGQERRVVEQRGDRASGVTFMHMSASDVSSMGSWKSEDAQPSYQSEAEMAKARYMARTSVHTKRSV